MLGEGRITGLNEDLPALVGQIEQAAISCYLGTCRYGKTNKEIVPWGLSEKHVLGSGF